MKALIFAAGMGTRLQEHTQNKPKALVMLGGKPLLQHAIEHLKSFGITDITINVFHFADQIIEFVNDQKAFGITIHISDERDQLLDTGGGLLKAAHFLKGSEPVLLYNVDVISNLDIQKVVAYHTEQKNLATLVVRKRETSRYLMFDQTLQLSGWKNFATGESIVSREQSFNQSEPFAFSGIHVISPEIFGLIEETSRFPIIDLYLRLAKQHTIKGYPDNSDFWMDLGKPDQLAEAEKRLAAPKN